MEEQSKRKQSKRKPSNRTEKLPVFVQNVLKEIAKAADADPKAVEAINAAAARAAKSAAEMHAEQLKLEREYYHTALNEPGIGTLRMRMMPPPWRTSGDCSNTNCTTACAAGCAVGCVVGGSTTIAFGILGGTVGGGGTTIVLSGRFV